MILPQKCIGFCASQNFVGIDVCAIKDELITEAVDENQYWGKTRRIVSAEKRNPLKCQASTGSADT